MRQRLLNRARLSDFEGTITRTSNIRREQPLLIRCCQAGRLGLAAKDRKSGCHCDRVEQ